MTPVSVTLKLDAVRAVRIGPVQSHKFDDGRAFCSRDITFESGVGSDASNVTLTLFRVAIYLANRMSYKLAWLTTTGHSYQICLYGDGISSSAFYRWRYSFLYSG